MKLRASLAALVSLVLVVAVAPEATGKGGTPITSCGQVVTTDAYLTTPLYCSEPDGDAVVVGASGITIDLKGFTLFGDRLGYRNGISNYGGYDQVTVRNGIVRNFYIGVRAGPAANDFTVSNLVVSGTINAGIFIDGESASVKSSTISGNDSTALGIENGDSTKIQSLTVSGNGHNGVVVEGDSTSIKSSTSIGNADYGMYLAGDMASVASSTVSGNGLEGIRIIGDVALLKGNRADSNGFGGASDLAGFGINVIGYTTAPIGKNVGRGNDNPNECDPHILC